MHEIEVTQNGGQNARLAQWKKDTEQIQRPKFRLVELYLISLSEPPELCSL